MSGASLGGGEGGSKGGGDGSRAGRDRSARRLAQFLGVAGLMHFVVPKFYEQMIPPQLPGAPRTWVYGSGVCEMAVGAAVALPRTRSAGARAAFWLFLLVLPGNVQMWWDARRASRPPSEQAALTVRLPMQVPLLFWSAAVRRRARSS
jgi:uncharacterized membrane protein